MAVPPTIPWFIVPPTEVAERTAQRMASAARHAHLPLGITWEAKGPAAVPHEVQPGVWGWDGRVIGEDAYWEVEVRVRQDLEAGHRVEVLVEYRALPQRMALTDVHLAPLWAHRDLMLGVFGLVKDVCRVARCADAWTPAEATRAAFARPTVAATRHEPTIAEERGELPLGGRRVA